ncbi:hypothetical protein I4U23_017343 [Adineta vaga]|nr:hypothetical protein I4U23_017343 [Adineta vaga]
MLKNLVFFVPYHTGYAHVELILSFASFADVHLFIYKWNPAQQLLRDHFSLSDHVYVHEFSIDTILTELIHQQEQQCQIVVLLTASINYSFGQLQYRFFRTIQNNIPSIIDVYSTGHCMYGCQSCDHKNSHRLPITFTNYIRTKQLSSMKNNKTHPIVVCPSFSSEEAPFSLLSNVEVIELIATFSFEHVIKLHPSTYPSNNGNNPLFTLGTLERKHADQLLKSKNIIPDTQTNTLDLIEHARVIICDFDSSIPFEALYFNDEKFLLVYEAYEQQHKEDDRRQYFHTFHNAQELTNLLKSYFAGELECKTKNSHEFFLTKYEEPDGNEIERLAHIRHWMISKDQQKFREDIDTEKVKKELKDQFSSSSASLAQMNLYVLGEYTAAQIEQICYADLHDAFDSLLDNVDQL